MLEVAVSDQVATCVWLAGLCSSTAHSQNPITFGGFDMQFHGCGSVFEAHIAFSLMKWRREAHSLDKMGLTSISDLKAG
jgi:hypothetical protein